MKKVLSLLLVVTMLFSMFAISSSAVINDGAIIAIKATPTGESYKPGETITFEVSMQNDANIAPDGIGGGTYVFGYNSAVLEPIIDLSSKVDDYASAGVIVDGYAFGESGYVIAAASYVKLATDTIVQADLDKGWDKALHINLGTKAGSYKDFSTETKVFAFQMKVKEDAAVGSYEIGINETSTGAVNSKTWIDDLYGGFSGADASELGLDPGPVFDRQVSTFTVASAAEPTVSHEMYMGRMDDWDDATATKFDAGFVGRISGLDPNFDADGESQAIESIVVNITRDGTTLSGKAHQLYAQDDGTYLFRAVVLGADISDDVNITYEYIVTLTTDADSDGNNDTVTYSSTDEDLSFNAIHAEANGRRTA